MKTSLISLLTAVLLGSAIIASGRLIDAADIIAISFAAALVGWTVAQYSTQPRALTRGRRLHLPKSARTSFAVQTSLRQAA